MKIAVMRPVGASPTHRIEVRLRTKMKTLPAVVLWMISVSAAEAQISVTGLELRSARQITPFGTAVIEVVVTGARDDGDGRKYYGRLRRGGFRITTNDAGEGWLSKPFQCQDESNTTYLSEDRSGFAQFFGTLAEELTGILSRPELRRRTCTTRRWRPPPTGF